MNFITGFLSLLGGIIVGITIINRLIDRQGSISYKQTDPFNNAAIDFAKNKMLRLEIERNELLKSLDVIERELNLTKSVLNFNTSLSYRSIKKIQTIEKKITKSNSFQLQQPKHCQYDFKVYVYEIPNSLDSIRISEEARRNYTLHVCQKCILEQFSLEYIIFDFFTKFCGRTYNPEEADFFYLPLVRDAEYRFAMQYSARSRASSLTEKALLSLLETGDSTQWKLLFNITDIYWKKLNGGNHIIVMPAPVTNLRHESSQRGFFHYMLHLHAPIFIALEYTIDFVREYPVCSTQKNILAPYPTTDPDLFNGKLFAKNLKRDFLLYYSGGMHGLFI
jgi:hypothetical protein